MRSGGTTTSRGLGAGGRVAVGRRPTTRLVVGTLVAAATAVGTVTLAGCSGESDPPPTWTHTPVYESPWPEPTPTPTPTPTDPAAIPPERPAAMDEVSIAGAEAFATYYMELFPYVFATGDLEAYRTHSHPECIFCADVISTAEQQYAEGGYSTGGLIDVREVTALEVDPGKWWAISMDVLQHPSVDLDAAGAVVSEVPEKSFHLDMAVVSQDGLWLMRAVEYQRTDS